MKLNKKILLCFAAATMTLSASAVSNNGASLYGFEIPDQGFLRSMSDDGKWVVWNYPSNDEKDAKVNLINVATGKMQDFPLEGAQATNGSKAVPSDVTNDATMVVGSLNALPATYTSTDKCWTETKLPKGFTRGWNGEVRAVTPDGKSMIGWIYQSMTIFKGVLWVNGEPKCSDDMNLPTHKDMYERNIIDKSTYFEHEEKNTPVNVMFTQISSDGKHILVGIDHNYPAWGCCWVVYHVDTDTYDWIADDDVKGGYNFVDECRMSNNGKWIYAAVADSDTNILYNVETKETKRVAQGGSLVGNDGTIYYSLGGDVNNPISSFCIPVDGLLVDMHQMLDQTYGISFYDVVGLTNTGIGIAISDDSKVLAAMAIPRTDAYIVTLPKTLVESSKGVNLLNQYMVDPVSGSELSHFSKIRITLSYACKYNPEYKITLKDGDNVVATAEEITPVAGSNSFDVTFPEQVFAAGKEYVLNFPEGAFYIDGHAEFTNKNIDVIYKGREDGPVKMTAVSPTDGSVINEFSMKNSVLVTFNTKLKLVNGITGGLYENGSEFIKSNVVFEVYGNTLICYPPASLNFFKDSNYEIKIPAGVVTDVAGYCPNEAITLKYEGAYEREIESGTHPFQDDFNDPNASLGKWLLYEGDHRTPNTTMVSNFMFDADNTPWNFSIRDEELYDYAAASHSMYRPAGKSDDWMVTPMLRIANADYHLKFKTQSYLKSKKDRLKVLVLAVDEKDMVNSLDKTMVDRLRGGDVIFDEQLNPGNSETMLAGDWTEWDLSLAKYADKYIYIAFLNENEAQSMVFVDDVDVYYRGNYVVGTQTDEVVVEADDVTVKAYLTNQGDETINELTATFVNLNNNSTGKFTGKNLDIKKGQTYQFSFDTPMELEKGVENNYVIDFTIGDAQQSANGIVKDLKYAFDKKIVVEEVTGAWCGNCPQGILAFDYIESIYPGHLVPIAVHNGDLYANTAYEAFLEGDGYPRGYVNRDRTVYAPMYNQKFFSEGGNQTWFDRFALEMKTPADTRIKINSVDYCMENGLIEVMYDLEFALNKRGVNYNILPVVLENDLDVVQDNYLASYDVPEYGEWGKNGKYGQSKVRTTANHVARGIGGTRYDGISGLVPRNVEVDVNYGKDNCFGFKMPATKFWDEAAKTNEHVNIACLVIDAGTGRVVNADIIHKMGVKETSGVNEISMDAVSGNVEFTVAGGKVFANGSDKNVEVYTVSGSRVANRGLQGLYIVRSVDANGTPVARKIFVK